MVIIVSNNEDVLDSAWIFIAAQTPGRNYDSAVSYWLDLRMVELKDIISARHQDTRDTHVMFSYQPNIRTHMIFSESYCGF